MRLYPPCLVAHLALLAFSCGLPNPAADVRPGAEQASVAPAAAQALGVAPTRDEPAAASDGQAQAVASASGDEAASDMPPLGEDLQQELVGPPASASEDPSLAVTAAKPALDADPASLDDAALAREDERTRQALGAVLERAGLDTWEHPELERALHNPDGLPLPDLLRRRYEILRAVPQHAPADGWISSTFGRRPVPGKEREQLHKGIDIAAIVGTVVYAPGDGVVRFAGHYGGFGNYIAIVHGYGIVTKFAHNEELLVKAGDRVRMGDPIAKVGASGRARGMHLHYEVWVNDRSVDPLGFMPPVPGLSDDPDRLVAHTGEP